MKHAKRIGAAFLAVVLIAAMLVLPGSATGTYSTVSLGGRAAADGGPLVDLGLTETLTVTAGNPGVIYTLKLGSVAYYQENDPNSTIDIKYAPSEGTLTDARALDDRVLATVSFTGNEALTDPTKTYDADDTTLALINALTFDRPCILYWPVTKVSSSNDGDLSNYDHNKATDGITRTVMVLRVDDVNGELKVSFGFNTQNKFNKEQCEQWMKSSRMMGIFTDLAYSLYWDAIWDAIDENGGTDLPEPDNYEKLIPIEGVHLVLDEEDMTIEYPDTTPIDYKDNWDEIWLAWWKGTDDFSDISYYNMISDIILDEEGHLAHEDPDAADAVVDIDGLEAYMQKHPEEMKKLLLNTTNPTRHLSPEIENATTEYENLDIQPYAEGDSFARTFPYGDFGNNKFTAYEDEYPISKSLTVAKKVTGNQGRKDQYFKFTVVLMLPKSVFPEAILTGDHLAIAEAIRDNLTFTGDNSVYEITAEEQKKYNEEFKIRYSNLKVTDNTGNIIAKPDIRGPVLCKENSIPAPLTGLLYTMSGDNLYSTSGYYVYEIDFWLKHGESVTIGNIPANMKQFAVFERPSVQGDIENEHDRTNYYIDGYTVSNVLTYDENGTSGSIHDDKYPLTTRFQAFHSNDTVTFTNEKDTGTPTGLSLQTAAPIAGIVLALSLGAVVLLSRKRRKDRQV